ncbi:MAG: prolyl oligopeptidase family serine peptidase, partial [Chloroflexota bacterium]|nr:prolyl oligopeptidase family serine peptidase [Chloroflexota bacterium]
PLGGAAGTTDRWPLLLSVYPGPADGWECASLPLAAAGYAVLAVGPAYGFELEGDVDELARLLEFARAGAFPGVDGTRVAVLGGSYSALHVQRLLRRREDAGLVRAVVLVGAPSDLFDVRRRFAAGTFVPPFGLDQALIALGFPDREPLRYWRYSGAFHVRPDLPPTALVHSRRDEVVPFQQSEALARRLAEAGAPHELHVFEAASHYLLSEDADSRAIYDLTVGFLARHLTP